MTSASGGEYTVLELWRVWSYSFVAVTPRFTQTLNGNSCKCPMFWSNISLKIIRIQGDSVQIKRNKNEIKQK